jgi:hypothetical protein
MSGTRIAAGIHIDPWEPEDPDEDPAPEVLLAYWENVNSSEGLQRWLVADPWLLWRLARDLAGALRKAPRGTSAKPVPARS